MRSHPIVYLFLYARDLAVTRSFYEQTLGFSVLEEDPVSVKYDAGEIMLALNRGSDHGVEVSGERDSSTLIVFHVEDIDAMRAALEARGVAFSGETERYEIGATASFYDPDGHCVTLYQPSSEAMTWPSAEKIRSILAADSRSHTILRVLDAHAGAAPGTSAPGAGGPRLGRCKMVYVFHFISKQQEAARFYEEGLGLKAVERDPGSGVVKYDGGGILLATHLIEREPGTRATGETLKRSKSLALVCFVRDIRAELDALSSKGLASGSEVRRSEIGATARLEDPDGHIFYLYEPSAASMSWPSGAKIERLVQE